ncbi:tRNA-guanine transglycosylase, partial [bacterium]|nr:tRNA-guanine transglycosylase [bacterium]
MFSFQTLKQSKISKARVGEIKTPHGKIITPAFIPVATLGVIKGGLDFQDIEKTNVQCQITNTFHFVDLERVKLVKKAGGLHKFFNFNKPIFTDSGGFQVFSLGKGQEFGLGKISSIFPKNKEKSPRKKSEGLVEKIDKKGVIFRSPRTGKKIKLSPKLSAKTQIDLGADFIYLLDVCGSPLDEIKTAKKEMDLSHLWFKEFLKVKIPQKQRVFGIIQGGVYKTLREESTKFVSNLPVFGIAIGGALGKSKNDMYKIISWINKHIDWQKP